MYDCSDTPLTRTLFFPMSSAGGFEFGLRWRSVGLFHGMVWRSGRDGRNWGALAYQLREKSPQQFRLSVQLHDTPL